MRFKTCLLFLAFLPCFNVTYAYHLNQNIDSIISQVQPPIHIGIVIREAKTGKLLYKKLNNYLFPPASVQKLLTATAALKYLGPNFTYKTKIFINGKIKNHTLEGNVSIQFNGDPELTMNDIEQLIKSLKKVEIDNINGHVYLDVSAYDRLYYPPGWLWDDLSYSYAAPLSSAIINKNVFALHLTPSTVIGHPPTLNLNIPLHIVHFENKVRTTKNFNKHCPLTIYSDALNHYTLSGCLNKNWGRQLRNLSIRNPLPYVETLVVQAFKDNGIIFKGKIKIEKINKHYTLLTEHKSPPLRKILKNMLKKSDNLIADSLLKQIGHQYFKQPGSWENGIAALKKILADTKIDFKKNLIDDGAGLSHYNLLTPNQLSLLLQYIYSHPPLNHILLTALPISGRDGTLSERMISLAKNKRVYAKTGSMTGITALAGFINTKNMGMLSFVIMINGFVGKHKPYNNLEDKICHYLAYFPKGTVNG